MKIIGNGLIASAFYKYAGIYSWKATIFASGVSNSSCTDPTEFSREEYLLKKALEELRTDHVLVYFSTCSMYDMTLQDSLYIRHKMAMEILIRESKKNHLIVRLPNVVGATDNPYTLINYLFNEIVNGQRVIIREGATRNIIDVDDVANVVAHFLLWPNKHLKTINVAAQRSHRVETIVNVLEDIAGKKALKTIEPGGVPFHIDISHLIHEIPAFETHLGHPMDYLVRTLKKYYGEPID